MSIDEIIDYLDISGKTLLELRQKIQTESDYFGLLADNLITLVNISKLLD